MKSIGLLCLGFAESLTRRGPQICCVVHLLSSSLRFIRRIQTSGVFARRHSQMRMTFHPNWRRRRLARRSRAWVRVILSCHAFGFVFDVKFLQLCPCQKQPSTKTATFSFKNAKSGRPGRVWFRLQPVRRHSRIKRTRRSSVVLLPLLRTRVISSPRRKPPNVVRSFRGSPGQRLMVSHHVNFAVTPEARNGLSSQLISHIKGGPHCL